jgi:hypothetical protein
VAKGICPVCDSLEFITTTGVALEYRTDASFARVPVGSACYWQLVVHVDRRGAKDEEGRWPLCDGSGKRV